MVGNELQRYNGEQRGKEVVWKSQNSLFSEKIATFEDDEGAYNQKDAEGFIKLNALRLRLKSLQ